MRPAPISTTSGRSWSRTWSSSSCPECPRTPLDDPRRELSEQLLRYAQTKAGAALLEALPRVGAGISTSALTVAEPLPPPEPSLERLREAMATLQARREFLQKHAMAPWTFSA